LEIKEQEDKVSRTVKYADDLVLLAKEEKVLQGTTYRLYRVRLIDYTEYDL